MIKRIWPFCGSTWSTFRPKLISLPKHAEPQLLAKSPGGFEGYQ